MSETKNPCACACVAHDPWPRTLSLAQAQPLRFYCIPSSGSVCRPRPHGGEPTVLLGTDAPSTGLVVAEPQPGSPDHEYQWGGVAWYFVSTANRDVFMRAPDVYAPQHGGYCEMSLARGYLSDGKPKIYAISRMKLYLFYSAANREAFLLAKDTAVNEAAVNWDRLSHDLVGPAPATEAASATPAGVTSTVAASH